MPGRATWSKRANPDRTKGVYRKILRGINDALDALINPLKVAEEYVARIGRGDIPEKINEAYNGDFNTIKNNLNNCIDEMHILVDEVGVVIGLAREGNLVKRANPDRTKGVYRKILRGINDALDALINPLKVAEEYVARIGRGDIPEKINETYNGDFNTIKDSLNNCIEEINGVIGEMGSLVRATSEGVLTKRGDVSRFRGAYKEMVQGMNGLIDSIANPLSELMAMLNRLSNNDYTQKMLQDYSGVWKELKGATNTTLDRMLSVQNVAIRVSNGDLGSLDEFKKIGRRCENDHLVPSFTRMMETIESVMGKVDELARAIIAGDLNGRGNENEFRGAYREIIHGMNGLMESVANPLNEMIAILNRLAVNDYTKKITKDYSGAWDELKTSANLVCDRMAVTVRVLINVSKGDMCDLEGLKQIGEGRGRRSENDTLVPAGIGLIESVEALADDIEILSKAAVDGNLSTRADASRHQGTHRKIVEGFNATLDAMLLPINEASACLREMAMGNLDVEVRGDYQGDHAVIKENLNATLASLNDVLNQVTIAVDQVSTGARQVSDSSQSLSQAATESASSLEEITASMHEMTSQTGMNAENATQANQLATQARISAEKGNAEMGNMVRAMNEINESASSISKIIKAIDEIAFQTNLLALNAAVEAARAGKHGKGFAVVAEEVRNLAQRSAAAAKETAEMIEGSIKKTEVGTRIAEETSKALEEIVTGSTKVTDLIGEIAAASKEQAQGIGQVNTGLSQVDQVTQQVTASAEESASASEELSSQSLQLKQMLTKFRLKRQSFSLAGSGLPEGITPEMLQMLKNMLQSQQMSASSGVKSLGKSPRTIWSGAKPSDLIALDDDDGNFGKF